MLSLSGSFSGTVKADGAGVAGAAAAPAAGGVAASPGAGVVGAGAVGAGVAGVAGAGAVGAGVSCAKLSVTTVIGSDNEQASSRVEKDRDDFKRGNRNMKQISEGGTTGAQPTFSASRA